MSPRHIQDEAEVRARIDGSCPRVQMIDDGPALVRGAVAVRDAAGVPHPVTRPVVAVCTCGLSRRSPWCDGIHREAAAARQGDRTTP